MKAGQAVVVKIGARYFYGFGKCGQVLTAWSLPGARLFSDAVAHNPEIDAVSAKLEAKGKKFSIVIVGEL